MGTILGYVKVCDGQIRRHLVQFICPKAVNTPFVNFEFVNAYLHNRNAYLDII